MRFGVIVAFACVASCWSDWSDDDTVNGFTAAQWQHFQRDLQFPPNVSLDICHVDGLDPARCQLAQHLGSALFTDVRLSCAALADDGSCSVAGTVSCATCHNGPGWIDTRSDNATSQGQKSHTSRNAMSVLNSRYKMMLGQGRDVFTWSGGVSPTETFKSPGAVLRLAIEKPMTNTQANVEKYVGSAYATEYQQIFNTDAPAELANIERVFDAFLVNDFDLSTQTTPFDSWLAGTITPMSDSAKRGFSLFVGKAGCISCHNGPLFSDLDFHNTGVMVADVTMPDGGRVNVTRDPTDTGKFLTGPLRDIASTGPYMHNGLYPTLHDVIEFYRRGGDAGIGVQDPRIQPLDLSEADESDLEQFLRSLTDCDDTKSCPGNGSGSGSGSGNPMIDAGIGSGSAMPDASVCNPPDMLCPGAVCIMVWSDPSNCGTCGHVCTYPTLNCVSGQCVQ